MQWIKDILAALALIVIGATIFAAAVAFIPPAKEVGFQRLGIEHIGGKK